MYICRNKDYVDGKSFFKNITGRLLSHWCLKHTGIMISMGVFFAFYFYILKNPYFATTKMPLTIVDDTIKFQPFFYYLYISLWVYIGLVPLLLKKKKELYHYALYIGLVCLIGIISYIFFPTEVPSFDIDWSNYPEFSSLKAVDSAGNAFPSLHVATAFFTLFWLNNQLKQMHSSALFLWLNVLWCFGIVYSTMAIKQHVFLDVFGGLILGGLLAMVTLRHYRLHFNSSELRLN